jgi:putative endonuclease
MFARGKKVNAAIGRYGEGLATTWLKKKGYTIIARNYRKPFGEVDIIARDRDCLVFIEVKTRRSRQFGTPAEAVTFKKQQQISKVAGEYLSRTGNLDNQCRFDIISIVLDDNQPPVIDQIVNAFDYIG